MKNNQLLSNLVKQFEKKKIFSLSFIAVFSLCCCLSFKAKATADTTIATVVAFATLDAADGATDGVFNVTGSLTVTGTGAISGNVTGTSAIGKFVNINATGNITLLAGSKITSNQSAGSCTGGRGGDITVIAGSNITQEDGSIIQSFGCSGGTIYIRAYGIADIGGFVESRGFISGVGNNQPPGGGMITIIGECSLTVSDTVQSIGQDPGADLVHLEAKTVYVYGVVRSFGAGHALPTNPPNHLNPPYRPEKPGNATAGVEIWACSIEIDNTSGNKGEVAADLSAGASYTTWIDLFAKNNITIKSGFGKYAVHANNGGNNNHGGDVTLKSIEGTITTSGRAVQADGAFGGYGGNINFEAYNDINLSGPNYDRATGVSHTGGNIFLSAFNGSIIDGIDDTLNVDGNGTDDGTVTLKACLSIDNPYILPVTVVPSISTGVLCGTSPLLPAGDSLPECGSTATCSIDVRRDGQPAPPTLCASADSLQLCGPDGADSYVWTPNGETTQCIWAKLAGTYSLTVNGGGECGSTCFEVITKKEPVECLITGKLSFCKGGSTELCANANADSYLWSPGGATTSCITVTAAGTYSVTSTAGGCSTSCEATVTEYAPDCTISGNASICAGGSTQWCGPDGQDAYLWAPGGQTTKCITVSAAGTYSLTTTIGDCSKTCEKTLSESGPSCDITGNPSVCGGNSTQWCGPDGQDSYLWAPGGATTKCINVSAAGTYSLTTTIGSCSKTCTKTLDVTNPNCDITGNPSVCAGSSTQWCGPDGQDSYLWAPGGATTKCIDVSVAGTYSLTTAIGSCSKTCEKTLTVNTPSCDITGNPSVCAGSSTQWCGPDGQDAYLWAPGGATTKCINVSVAGTYSLTATKGGCSKTCTKTLTVNTPNCNITGGSSICEGGAGIEICAAAGQDSYVWAPGGATTSCITVTAAGTYTVTVTKNGCTKSCTKTISVNNPSCDITGNSSVCSGSSTQWCGPNGQDSYLWAPGGATTKCINVSVAGTYSLTATKGGCSKTCTKTLTVNTPDCSITGLGTICTGSSTQWCAAAGQDSYLWSPGSKTTSCITVSAAGTYSVTVTKNGCTKTCTKTLSTSKPSCNIGNVTSPPCGSTGNKISASPTTGVGYSWSVTSTSNDWVITSPITDNPITYTAGAGGTATFTVVITDNATGCTSTCSKSVSCTNPYWGCTIGFWKNHTSLWDNANDAISKCVAAAIVAKGAPYSGDGTTSSLFRTTFGLTSTQMTDVGLSANLTLIQALNLGGGGVYNLARQGVAALLNSCGLKGNYQLTSAQVLTQIHDAIVTKNVSALGAQLDKLNSEPDDMCPAGGKATKRLMNDAVVVNENIVINAYPNPFEDKTTIELMPSVDYSSATVELLDLNGQRISLIYAGPVSASQTYRFEISGDKLAAGIYIYSFKAGEENIFGKVVLIK